MSRVRFRISVCPLDHNDPAETFFCDMDIDESAIQTIDQSRGFEDFIERYIHPAMDLILDRFQQPYESAKDLTDKCLAAGGALPRSIKFYREKAEMDKARRRAA